MIAPEHRDSFAEYAAPEAIEHQLRQAKVARRQAQREVEWLAEVAGRRSAEVAAGTWPSKPDHTPDVDHTRGAAEALAHVRRLLDRAYPGLKETTARVIRHAAAELGVAEDAPPARASLPVSAERPPVGGSGRPEGPEAISGGHGPHT